MRPTPGTEEVDGRGFAYLECETADAFKSLFPMIATFGASPLPASGGAINEDFALILPDGVQLFALSYKGDLEGWKRKVAECAEALGMKFGEVVGDCLQVKDNGEVSLSDCKTKDLLAYK
jgi:hypothetical protein